VHASAGLAPSRALFGWPELARGTLGDAAPLVWQEEKAMGDAFPIESGGRYAVLASVSHNYSVSEIVDYLDRNGWTVTYAWEQGTATRDLYAIDTWLSSLVADPTNNHRWVYGEANRTGAAEALSSRAPWPFTFYSIAHVFRAVPAPPSAPGPDLPSPATPPPPPKAIPASVLVVGGGAVVLAVGYALWRWVL
jgi:hypothetical protein